MKTFVHVLLVAACLVACARALPGARRDSFEDDFEDGYDLPNLFTEALNRARQHLLNYFWNMSDMTDFKMPPEIAQQGANTTSTVKVINGHVITINETTYTSGDDNGGSTFRIRIVDIKPQNDTLPGIGSDAEVPTKPAPESAETVEDFNNEISKNVETLTA